MLDVDVLLSLLLPPLSLSFFLLSFSSGEDNVLAVAHTLAHPRLLYFMPDIEIATKGKLGV